MAQNDIIATVTFTDQENRDEGVAIVRTTASGVGLAASLRRNADIEVFLSEGDARALSAAVERKHADRA